MDSALRGEVARRLRALADQFHDQALPTSDLVVALVQEAERLRQWQMWKMHNELLAKGGCKCDSSKTP